MIRVFDGVNGIQVAIAAVIGLIGLCTVLAWLPATRRDPTGLATRVFITVGLCAAILDDRGLGTVLGLALAAMGVMVSWEGQPAPEVPRPRRRGFYVAAVLAGAATYGTVEGWGPLDRIPADGRPVAALFVGLVAVLATLAIADRSRVTFRDRLRRRFSTPTPRPRMLVAPIDRPPEHSVTIERLADDSADTDPHAAVPALDVRPAPAALLPAQLATPDDTGATPAEPERTSPEPTSSTGDDPEPVDTTAVTPAEDAPSRSTDPADTTDAEPQAATHNSPD